MKKFISVMLCVCICLSSTVFCFADFTSTDSTTLSNIYKYMPTASQVTTLNNTLSTISTRVLNIYNALFASNHSVAYWVEAINSWMSPIYGRLADIITNTLNIEAVAGLLGSTDVVDGTTVRTPYLAYNSKGVAEWVSGLTKSNATYYFGNSVWNQQNTRDNAHTSFVNTSNGNYNLSTLGSNGSLSNTTLNWTQGSPIGNLAAIMRIANNTNGSIGSYLLYNYNQSQTYTSWVGDSLNTSSFTPSSAVNGLYTWLSNIQTPVARLSYVLASDERIEAQEAAAANEDAVVDNFIDSSGSGAASPSDIGSVSNLSSGFKDNISTDASVSGIWNIFNSDNFGWFSQETADQLDTTGSGTKTLRSSGSYSTPLLDQQTEDILKYIGGDNND